jgi:hypothetical protein
MAQVILFGGGDGGGLIIGPNGVRPIPPFDPSIRLQLRGLSALVGSLKGLPEKPQREMSKLANKVSNLVVEQVEGVVGRLEGDNSLIYQDDDGGFTCGSTGKPPIPFPWPPVQTASLGDLIRGGLIERDLVDFLGETSAKGIKIREVLENPAETARTVGRELSERAVKDLQQLAPSRLKEISDPVNREVAQFFHKIADDGRFLSTWTTRPAQVAKELRIDLSDKAFDRIIAGGSIASPFDAAIHPGIAVTVAIVVMLYVRDEDLIRSLVKDRSGVAKF